MTYQEEFITFMVRAGVLTFGDFTTKSGRRTPYFINTGNYKTGMTEQMTSLANLGCLGNFIGMLTDSRSFLSYTRHEYFRRILCNLIGGWVENGEYPADMKALEEIVKGICYNNSVKYFGFKLDEVK